MIYAFIEAQKANHRVSAMCRALEGLEEWFLWLARQSALGTGSGRRPAFGEDSPHPQR